MAWSTIATLTPSKQWAFTPVTNATFFRIKHIDSPFAPVLWICQAAIDDSGVQLFDVKKLSEEYLNQVVRLDSPPVFTDRAIGIKSNIDSSRWQVQIEASDYVASASTPTTNIPPFTPKSLPNLAIYWNAANAIKSTDSKISRLTGLTNSQILAVQDLDSLQPTWVDNGINGKPTIRFSGGQYFTHNYLGEVGTIIVVVKAIGTGHQTLTGAKSDRTDLGAYYFKTNDPDNKMSASRILLGQATSSSKLNNWYIQSARVTSNATELFVNSDLVATTPKSGQAILINEIAVLGAGYYNNTIVDVFNGEVAEFLIASQPLSDDDLTKTINYFKSLYNI